MVKLSMTLQIVKKKLIEYSESVYASFSTTLIPESSSILGVRVPTLRKLAKEVSKDNYHLFLTTNDFSNHELKMVHAFVLGYVKEVNKLFTYLDSFLPYVSDWAVCDGLVSSLKITQKEQAKMWEYISQFKTSAKPYYVRFMLVMMLSYYLNDTYIDEVLKIIDTINLDHYYVKMAVAWALAIALTKQREKTILYLENSKIDDWTYNKALQKMKESFCVSKEDKELLSKKKRNKKK